MILTYFSADSAHPFQIYQLHLKHPNTAASTSLNYVKIREFAFDENW